MQAVAGPSQTRAEPLAYSADATAQDHLLVHVPVVRASASARQARAAALAHPDGGLVYVVEDSGELAGVLPLSTLLGISDEEPIQPHLDPAPRTLPAHTDQEDMALEAVREGLAAVPVADEQGRFVGIVPASALLRVLHHEHLEDLDRFSGVLRRREHVAHALGEPPAQRAAARLPWLLVGLVGSALATWVMAEFEASLQRRVAVAFFVPGIVYLADAIGTQTETVAVRSLSHREPHVWRVFLGELCTGFLVGLALALPVLPAVGWIFHDYRLGAAVSLAIVFGGTIATGVGFVFPMLLARWGQDPALGSGPIATVFQDGLSLVAYFVAVRLLLP